MTGDSARLARFTLYETRHAFWIVGQNSVATKFRVLKLEPVASAPGLEFTASELPLEFSSAGIATWLKEQQQLARDDDGDEFRQKAPLAWGLLGAIRFTAGYYLCLVTKCSVVAQLGGNEIYHIDETKLVPLVHSSRYEVPDRRSAEARLASTFHSLDLAKTFYFSPTYDLTNTLQTNLQECPHTAAPMFVWNSHLLAPLAEDEDVRVPLATRRAWFMEIVHGFIDQARISVFGNSVFITIIARRSHHFAGARFYKRGVNNQGYPANEVETEQIVSNQQNSQFSDRYTSYVQHRGSIPVSWSQMSNNMSPQPPIRIDAVDPYYAAAAKHFDRMFSRYGYPIKILNLVKTRERRPRESVLSREFEGCVRYLNQFLPQNREVTTEGLSTRSHGLSSVDPRVQTANTYEGRPIDKYSPSSGLSLDGGIIEYTHWDMSYAAKSRSTEVMDYLGKYAKKTLEATSIFQVGKSLQHGVCRTNCIDCLDRTNAAQSVIAKYALGYQLYVLGIIDQPKVDYDTDVMDLLTEMYHDHGDTIALQYGGSNLVNTVETYRRINQWSSHSRDLIESLRRFYSNSFMDAQRQDAINVFLGNYQYMEGTNLWDLSTDYYLHNTAPDDEKHSYRQWYEPRHLLPPLPLQPLDSALIVPALEKSLAVVSSTGTATELTSLSSLFLLKMNSTNKYSKQQSPFEVHGKRQKRHKDSGSKAVVSDKPEKMAKRHPSAPDDMELELLYAKYLGLAPNSTPAATVAQSHAQDSVDASTEADYAAYFELPKATLDIYQAVEPEWTSTPMSEWTSSVYSTHVAA